VIATRHLAIGKCTLYDLAQLRAPMNDILSGLEEQLRELNRYKAKYGKLDDDERITEVKDAEQE